MMRCSRFNNNDLLFRQRNSNNGIANIEDECCTVGLKQRTSEIILLPCEALWLKNRKLAKNTLHKMYNGFCNAVMVFPGLGMLFVHFIRMDFTGGNSKDTKI